MTIITKMEKFLNNNKIKLIIIYEIIRKMFKLINKIYNNQH